MKQKQKTASGRKAAKGTNLDTKRVLFIHRVENDGMVEGIGFAREEYAPKQWRQVLVFYKKESPNGEATVKRTDYIAASAWWSSIEGVAQRFGLDWTFDAVARSSFLDTVSSLLIELHYAPGRRERPQLLNC